MNHGQLWQIMASLHQTLTSVLKNRIIIQIIKPDCGMPRTIAIVEDEPAIRENYSDALRRQGYRVQAYGDSKQALTAFEQRLPDLVLLDISLEDGVEAGFDLCRQLRGVSASLPIIFLTARDNDLDSISGLRLGADDYLTKDISLPHLQARIAALFRRMDALSQSQETDATIQHGELTLDTTRLQATWHGEPVDLTVTEFWLLYAIARRPGQVKNREQLMEAASIVVDDTTITSHIKRIRRKFLKIDSDFNAIDTVYGMGYRWHTSET